MKSGIDSNRWAEIDALFEATLEKPANERREFLRSSCGEDLHLYDTVFRLLEADSEAESSIGESAADFASTLLEETAREDDLAPGTTVGPYLVENEIGRGGMGVVYRARRDDGAYEKNVALKVVKRGMDTDEVLRHFRFERKVLAALDHPGIARLLDAGATADGRPYLVMELAHGEPITDFVTRHNLSTADRLALFQKVCIAVRYAHQNLVVHRDLKPSNVLAHRSDSGEFGIKLLDFGIAKLLGGWLAPETPVTKVGVRVLTPEYAAPEQKRGERVTTATDVYSLGVILYEMLTGKRPNAKLIPPSEAVTDPHIRRQYRGEIDAIVLTALHEDSDRRYASAEALLDDLQRRSTGMPLHAAPDSATYRAKKFVLRNRLLVTAAAVALMTLASFTAVLFSQQSQTRQARDEALATSDFLGSLLANPSTGERQDTLRVRSLLSLGAKRVRTEFEGQPRLQGQLLHEIGDAYLRLGLYPQADSVLTEAIILRRQSGSPVELATSLVRQSNALREVGRTNLAEAAGREAMSIASESKNDILLSDAEKQIAYALTDLGQSKEAEEILTQSIARLVAQRSTDNRARIAEAEQVMGRTLLNGMHFDAALAAYRRSLDLYTEIGGPNGAQRIGPLREISFTLLAMGEIEDAVLVGEEAVELTRLARPHSGSLANMLTVHGMTLNRSGQLKEAEQLFREAITLPPRRPADRAIPLSSLASVLAKQGVLAEAERYQSESYSILLAIRGTKDAGTLRSRVKLAEFVVQQKRFAEAEQVLLESYGSASVGEESIAHEGVRVRAARALASLYREWGRPQEAAKWEALTVK